MNGDSGSLKFTRLDRGRSRSAARATSGEWNAPGHLQLDGAARPLLLRPLAALVDSVVLAGDDDLAGQL